MDNRQSNGAGRAMEQRSVLTEDVRAGAPVAGALLHGGVPLHVDGPVLGVHVCNLSHGVAQMVYKLRESEASCPASIQRYCY